jgi:uncharacterized repeat protein (TIGR01451 family)
VLGRALSWFQPLRATTFAVDRAVAEPDTAVRYALTLENPGQSDVMVSVTNPLPVALTLVRPSLTGADYDPASRTVAWKGTVAAGGRHTITYTAALDPAFRGTLENEATVGTPSDDFILAAHTVVPVRVYLPVVTRSG